MDIYFKYLKKIHNLGEESNDRNYGGSDAAVKVDVEMGRWYSEKWLEESVVLGNPFERKYAQREYSAKQSWFGFSGTAEYPSA